MLTDSITHVLNVTLQYIALILALLLYEWVKEEYMYLRYRHRERAKCSRQASIAKRLRVLYQYYRDLRRELGLTQEEFAAKMGVDPRTVQRWESGEARPQPRHYSKFQQLQHQDWNFEEDWSHRIRRLSPHAGPPFIAPRDRVVYRWKLLLIALGLLLIIIVLYLILHFWLHLI